MGWTATTGGERHRPAHASPRRSGDELAGLAAPGEARCVARRALAEPPLRTFLPEHVDRVSSIHPRGRPTVEAAADRLAWLTREALARRPTGAALRDEAPTDRALTAAAPTGGTPEDVLARLPGPPVG